MARGLTGLGGKMLCGLGCAGGTAGGGTEASPGKVTISVLSAAHAAMDQRALKASSAVPAAKPPTTSAASILQPGRQAC